MDAKRMIEELTAECTALTDKRASIVAQSEEIIRKVKENLEISVRKIDDDLTAYRMAIESLEMTVKPAEPKQDPVAEPVTAAPSMRKPRKGAKLIEYNGKKLTYAQWEKETGINRYTITYRIDHGWSVEDALTTPINPVFSTAGKKCEEKPVEPPKNLRAMPRKVFAYDQHGNVVRQFIGIGEASRELHMPVDVIEKTITAVPKQDQLKSRDYYLAYVG